MKITNDGKKIKTYYIEVDDQELGLLCDAMDSKFDVEFIDLEKVIQYGWKANTKVFGKVKELSKILHNAFMGKI